MNCKSCGNKIGRNAKFCPYCGSEQIKKRNSISGVTENSSNNNQENNSKDNQKNQETNRLVGSEEERKETPTWNIYASVFGLIYYIRKGLWKKGVIITSILFLTISVLSFLIPTYVLFIVTISLHIFIFGYLGNKDIEKNEVIWKKFPSFLKKRVVLIGIGILSLVIFLFSISYAHGLIVRDDYLPFKGKITQHNEMENYRWTEGPYKILERENQYAQDSKTAKNFLKQYQGTWMDEEDTGIGIGILNDKIYLIDYDTVIDVVNFDLKIAQSRTNYFSPISQLVTFSLDSATDYITENINSYITGVKLGLDPTDNKQMILSTHDDSNDLTSANMTLTTLNKINETFNPNEVTYNIENDYSYGYNQEYDENYEYAENEELMNYVNNNNDSDLYDLYIENGILVVSTTDIDALEEEDRIRQNIGIAQSISNHVSSQVGRGISVCLEEPFQYDFSVTFVDGQPLDANDSYYEILNNLGIW